MKQLRDLIRRFRSKALSPAARQGRNEVEVAACLPVLELLEAQIRAAVQKGVESVDQLCSEFGAMATKAQQVVSDAGMAGDALHEIADDLRGVQECMRDVETIVRKTRLVSLNGRIEACSAGEHGKGFSVVAAETGELALQVTNTSSEIQKVVDKMSIRLRSTSEGNLTAARESSDNLASAINRSVMGLQFQDAVSQRMNHVANELKHLREHIQAHLDHRAVAASKDKADEWLNRISTSYCVADERAVMAGTTGSAATEDSTDIELF
ncbi:MAG: hypothetical protein KDA96_01500 [Planctomycetaceae bacterium]|nr:hypothetical protein [Planctomycetaceae bacterium]